MLNIAVLVSGGGTNLQAIIDAIADGVIQDTRICLVLSNNDGVYALERAKKAEIFVLEAALLLEDGYKQICDEMWYIYTDEMTRRYRLKESREYSDEKIDAIMASQLSEEVFRKECQILIDNSGDFKDTCYQIEKFMKQE